MENGTIKTLKVDRGFGFIAVEGGQDVFFHVKGLSGVQIEDLRVGDAVTFELENTPKGPSAVNVQRA